MSNDQRMRALFGDEMPRTDTERNLLLRNARHIRALRSWVTPGCYAWFMLTDDLHSIQRKMANVRALVKTP